MRTISIVLGDNDFGSTFINLLESVYRFIKACSPFVEAFTSEEVVAEIIRAGIKFHYLAYQHDPRREVTEYNNVETTTKYLLDGIKILFDEEAELDILHIDHDGGAWYLEVYSGRVSSY
jgi:hypothetical protein